MRLGIPNKVRYNNMTCEVLKSPSKLLLYSEFLYFHGQRKDKSEMFA